MTQPPNPKPQEQPQKAANNAVLSIYDGKLWNRTGRWIDTYENQLAVAKTHAGCKWLIEVYENPSDIRYQERIEGRND